MKKIWLLIFSLLILLASFNISFAGSHSEPGFAKDPAEKVNYELPYPGLLPDSPLYFLRIIRDKTVGFLIADPKKKAEFDLLQADKRLNAGIYLFKKNKIAQSLSTVSKAENYFQEAIQKIKEARRQGTETTGIINKLIDSSKKHQEVLRSLMEKTPQNFKVSFNRELQRINDFEKEVISLTLK